LEYIGSKDLASEVVLTPSNLQYLILEISGTDLGMVPVQSRDVMVVQCSSRQTIIGVLSFQWKTPRNPLLRNLQEWVLDYTK